MHFTRPPTSGRPSLPVALLLLISSLVAGCGGGGGAGNAADAPPTTPATSTAMAAFQAPAQMPQNFRAKVDIPAAQIADSAAALPSSAGPTWLKVWFVDPATGEPCTLSFGRFNAAARMPMVQIPLAVSALHYEVYNAAGAQSGRWALQ